MESANFGKRLLYGFAGFLLGPAILVFILLKLAPKFMDNPPVWFWWLLVIICLVSSWFGYHLPSKFEKVFETGLTGAAPFSGTPLTGAYNLARQDKSFWQSKTPLSMGLSFFFVILTCFILIFTRFGYIVPYIFGGFWVIFMIWIAIYFRNK